VRKIIRELEISGNKIFCIDLTGETKRYLIMEELIDNKNSFAIAKQPINKNLGGYIKQVVDIRGTNYGRNPPNFDELIEGIESHIKTGLQAFIGSDKKIGILELPELSNTEETLEYTKFFFKALFDLAKNGAFKDKSACLILEEAHTLIPEWNSVGGTDDKTARRLTNTIAQIALQGRKYNVGLLVIAQRTANVSKTILTQCNTIISFKQFDNTSKDFLVNHFGDSFIGSLSMLKNRRAIIAGKALISDVPIIFKVPEIKEKEITQTIAVGKP
jgi:DNA helicase HerA-like ATPase